MAERVYASCPPVASGICAQTAGDACALAATCCVNAVVPQVAALRDQGGGNTSEKGALGAAARWGREREAA